MRSRRTFIHSVFLFALPIVVAAFGWSLPAAIGAVCLMLGGFSRFGVWPQILLAVALVIPLQMIWNAAEAAAIRSVELQYLAYVQPAAAALLIGVLAWLAMRRRRPRRLHRSGEGPA